MRLRWSGAARLACVDARGQTTTEYALILAALAMMLLVGILVFAGHLDDVFHRSAPDAPALQTPSAAECDPHYVGACIPPPPPDLDCADLAALGITGVVRVVGGDPQGLDPDRNGVACD